MRAVAWIGAIVGGIVIVVVVTAVIGNRDDDGATVTAAEWAQNVCGAVGVWRGQLEATVDDLSATSASAGGDEEPQSETPQGQTGLVRTGLERGIEATETMVVAVDNAGIPDSPEGEEAARVVDLWANTTLDDLGDAEESLDEEADTLEQAISQLTDAAGAIGNALTSGVEMIADVAQIDTELAAALRDSSTCQELREAQTSS